MTAQMIRAEILYVLVAWSNIGARVEDKLATEIILGGW